jgi:hypothetical protein
MNVTFKNSFNHGDIFLVTISALGVIITGDSEFCSKLSSSASASELFTESVVEEAGIT